MTAGAADRTRGAARTPLPDLALAFSFLTILPVSAPHGDLRRAAAFFPLVGAVLGGLAGGLRAAAEPVVGGTAATVIGLIALVSATGALHQDGLADTADGLGVRNDRERRLAVMRDSNIGAFGTLALIGWALLMVSALQPLDRLDGVYALVAAGAIGRLAAVLHALGAPPARRDGLGTSFAPGTPAVAVATVLAVAAAAMGGVAAAAAALGAGAAAAAGSVVFARRTLGGRTGDTLGAAVAVTEAAVALALLAVLV